MNDEPSHPSDCDCKCPYCERFRAFEDVLSRVKRPVDKAFLKNILGSLLCAEAELGEIYSQMDADDVYDGQGDGEEWKQEKKPLRRPRKGDGLGGKR